VRLFIKTQHKEEASQQDDKFYRNTSNVTCLLAIQMEAFSEYLVWGSEI
jgi:hypothetical protein